MLEQGAEESPVQEPPKTGCRLKFPPPQSFLNLSFLSLHFCYLQCQVCKIRCHILL